MAQNINFHLHKYTLFNVNVNKIRKNVLFALSFENKSLSLPKMTICCVQWEKRRH